MLKRLLIVLIFSLFHSLSFGQSFQEGDLVLNAGVGFGNTFSFAPGGLSLPIGGGVEYGITNLEVGSIGIGGDFGFTSASGVTILYFGAKGSYHFNELFEVENEDLDIYGGFGLYYRSISWSGSSFSSLNSGIIPGFHAGTRYYFSDNIGGYAELGNNWGWLNLGLVFDL